MLLEAKMAVVMEKLWNCQEKMHPVLAAAQVGACGVEWIEVEGRVASSVSSPGSQALLVAGLVSRVRRARCRPAHVHTVSLGWH